MLLGAWIDGEFTPESWVAKLKEKNYRAAFCPIGPEAPDDVVKEYEMAARKAGIVIAETGAWSNPLSDDEQTRKAAINTCIAQLDLADRIGARCCVNISGSRGAKWDGPDARNLTDETFDMIVTTAREIIDAVNPSRSYYTLEPMGWMYPNSADSYLRLIKAIDRKGFGVHFDPVNMVSGIDVYYHNAEMITDFVQRLGPYIRSCHAKDISLSDELTVHLGEVIPGEGALCYRTYLLELSSLPPEMPLLIEHLKGEAQFDRAAAHIRKVAAEVGVPL